MAVMTGTIHVWISFPGLPAPLAVSTLLAGLGFFGAVGLLLLDVRRRLLYAVGVPYTAVQIGLFLWLNWPAVFSPGAVVDKTVQVALIGVLIVLYRRESA